ncbi:MAG: 23S rRNA (adenine(2503)-C(2))-methyltransferase RlmN [Deltaproteobacteria bacterium]|nr:23S rRNA (adenine(2503)-C(2))-methyltransferase RlmN [Deltaproteobacteria bacterium]
MRHPERHIFDLTPTTLAEWLATHREPAFRAKQILEWVYRRGVIDPSGMTNLPAKLRGLLSDAYGVLSAGVVDGAATRDGWHAQTAGGVERGRARGAVGGGQAGGGALRVLQAGRTDRQTECVMIPSLDVDAAGRAKRRTACISSQVGCPVGCKFCASGSAARWNLSTGRIVEQVWRLDRAVREAMDAADRASRFEAPAVTKGITHVVFMGMGEPLANFGNVVRAVRTLAADWGMGISARRITISTVGMHKAIERLAEELDLPVTLALSLHAPNDTLRRQLIPWAEFTTIDQLLSACDKWFEKTGREITLEYTLLRDVNDSQACAEELAEVSKRLRANVNLIRFNEVAGVGFKRPATERVRRFREVLSQRGVNVHIRASRGRDIAAACGQLRHESSGNGR